MTWRRDGSRGRSNEGISRVLFLSPKTIEAHIGRIFSKLGLDETHDSHRRVLAVLAFLRAVGMRFRPNPANGYCPVPPIRADTDAQPQRCESALTPGLLLAKGASLYVDRIAARD